MISISGKEQEILSSLQRGYILTNAKPVSPAALSALFEAEIETFDLPQAITLGWQATLHMHGMQETVMISKLFSCKSLWNEASEQQAASKTHPRLVPSECLAVVECKLMNGPIPMDLFHSHPQTGTFLLRSQGKTLASGKVTKIK
jgi:peptide chain release factor subunit 3